MPGKLAATAHHAPGLEPSLRIALLAFVFLAVIGATLGHVVRDSTPRVDDHVGMIRIKL
jgi:hypothetical protein